MRFVKYLFCNIEHLDYFDKAIALDPDFIDAYLRKGNCYHRLKRYTESIDCFDFVISREPRYLNGIAYFNKGNSLKEIKRIDDAIDCYQKAIKYQKKEDGDYYYNLGLCQFTSRKINSALESIDKSIQIKAAKKTELFEYLFTIVSLQGPGGLQTKLVQGN